MKKQSKAGARKAVKLPEDAETEIGGLPVGAEGAEGHSVAGQGQAKILLILSLQAPPACRGQRC